MHVESHLPLEELKRLEHQEKDADRAPRMRIVILAIEGWTAPAIAMTVGLSRRICQRWVARYNQDGLAGLDDRRGRTAQLPLSPEQEQECRREPHQLVRALFYFFAPSRLCVKSSAGSKSPDQSTLFDPGSSADSSRISRYTAVVLID